MIMEEKKTNPIDTKEKVQQSKDEHIDEDFPGYPHYPAREDILNPQNHTERVNANVENLTHDSLRNEPADKKKLQEPINPKEVTGVSPDETKGEDIDDLGIVMGTEADVTEEDLAMLGDKDQDMDMNEDELVRKEGLDDTDFDGDPLNEAAVDEDSTGDDLNIRDSGDEDARKEMDDEENDYYSLGGGDKDALNEGRGDEEK